MADHVFDYSAMVEVKGTGQAGPTGKGRRVESIGRSLAMIQTNQSAGLSSDEAMFARCGAANVCRIGWRLIQAELRRLADAGCD